MAEPQSAKPRILATDDQEEVLRLIGRALGDHYECEFASNVAEARQRLKQEKFDLALCDIEMPGESGLTLAEETVEAFPHTAVVLVTGVDDPDVAKAAFRLGVHGYLVKPFRPGQLLITTMSALRRSNLESALRAHSKALEDRLQMLMDRAPVPVYIKDREGRYLLANRVAHETAGFQPNELIGLRDTDFLSPEDERLVAESDQKILKDGGTIQTEETLEIGGEEKTFFSVKFPYVDDAGDIAGVSGIATDITGRKQAELLREELARAQQQAIEELRALSRETVDRLSRAIECHDLDTGEHITRMATVAASLGRRCGLDEEAVMLLRAAAPMHDVGKVATPDAILRKPGALSDAERAVMEQHTVVGHEILAGSDSELLRMAATIALTHHERWDGTGYPKGLSGGDIPLEGRIVAVADVFDALLSDRSYRSAMTVEQTVQVIRDGKSRHFDPEVADHLLDNLEEALALRGRDRGAPTSH